MKLADFKQAGLWPTLRAAFKALNLSIDEKFTLAAIPVPAGARV